MVVGPMSSFLVRTRFIAKRLHRFHRSYQTQNSHKKVNKVRSLCLVSAGSVLAYVGGALMLGDERFYRDYAMPAVHYLLDGEDAHRLAVAMAKWNIVPLDWWVSRPQCDGREVRRCRSAERRFEFDKGYISYYH